MTDKQVEDLIERLASDVPPVRRLNSPFSRTMVWFAFSLPWVAGVVFAMGVRHDIGMRMADIRWLVEQGAALMTAGMAAMAAFCAGVPGRPRWEHFMPLLPLALWIAALGEGCVQAWISFGASGLTVHPDWQCLPGIVIVGLGPAAAMTAMILRGSPIAPTTTTALGALASGGLAQFGLRLFHMEDASLMVLVWQTGTVFGLVMIAGILGQHVLRWQHAPAR